MYVVDNAEMRRRFDRRARRLLICASVVVLAAVTVLLAYLSLFEIQVGGELF